MGCLSSKQVDAGAAQDVAAKPSSVGTAEPAVTFASSQQQQQTVSAAIGSAQARPADNARPTAAGTGAAAGSPQSTAGNNGPAAPTAATDAPTTSTNGTRPGAVHDSASSARAAFAEWAKAEASAQRITLDEFVAINTASSGACASSTPPSTAQSMEAHEPPAEAGAIPPFVPYDTAALGAPKPACHVERDVTATAIARMRETRDGELEAILGALCRTFNTDTAAISLLTGDIISHIAACGIPAPSPPVCPQSMGFCGWSFVNTNHELLVIEDMKSDSRTADNVVVNDPFYDLSFYVGAPLISSDGHRLGTLCMTSQKPQKFDSDRAQFLANMTEVVVRQLERSWALQLAEQKEGSHLPRALACYDMAYMLVDASAPEWRVIYMNNASQDLLGVKWQFGASDLPALQDDIKHALKLDGVPLEAFFDAQNSTLEWANKGCEFTVHGVQGAPGTAMKGHEFRLTFKLATADGLDEQQPVQFGIGIPSHLAAANDSFGRSLFFVQLAPTAPAAAAAARYGPSCIITNSSKLSEGVTTKSWTFALSSSQLSGLSTVVPRGAGDDVCPVEGLVLGPLLGRGGYGRVYRGIYKGQPVAVKMIENISTLRTTESGEPLEAVVTRGVNHLGVMRTVTYAYSADKQACWMLFEYCDKGSVQDGVLQGWFRTNPSLKQGGVNLRAVALTAYEVASAMAFLHKHDIVHGDLKGGNVMLASSAVNPHGFTAKIGDYGLARQNGPALPNNVYGTVTHMPAEVLLEGGMTKATDVYSFGVMLWEMLTASKAWAGMRHSEIVCQVAILKRRLAIPRGLPPALEQLLARCLAPDMGARCTFEEALAVLAEFLQATLRQDLSSVQVRAASGQQQGDVDIMSL